MPRKAAPKKAASKDIIKTLTKKLRDKADENEVELSDSDEQLIDLDDASDDDDKSSKFKKSKIKKASLKKPKLVRQTNRKSQADIISELIDPIREDLKLVKRNLDEITKKPETAEPEPVKPAMVTPLKPVSRFPDTIKKQNMRLRF